MRGIVGSPIAGGSGGAPGGTGGQEAALLPMATGGGASPGTGGNAPTAMMMNGGSGGATTNGIAGQPGPMTGAGGTGGMMSSGGTGGSMSPAPMGDICARWKSDRADLSEGTWSGNAASCDAGDMTAAARQNAYRLHSLYRFMAGLEPVQMTDEYNRLAQDCALLMTANGMISHMPDSSWKCYTAEAAMTANSSSLSGGGGAVSSVDGYMIDPGNPTSLGHRRWILSNMLAGVGFGSTGMFSCQYQPPTRPAAGAKPWTAWPPPGEIPIQAFSSGFFAMLDQTGWSVQSDTIDLTNAQVKVTLDGMDQAVSVTQLGSGYGSVFAMRFNPMGWTTAAGKTYHVAITGSSMPIEYDVQVVDCP